MKSQRLFARQNSRTLSDGRIILGICGAEGENDDDQNDDGNSGADGDEDDDEGGSEEESKSERELALERRMKAADKRASDAEARAKKLEDAAKSAEQLEKEANEKAAAELEKAKEELKQARLENAFLTDNTFKWRNPKTALKLADLSEVEIGEDGSVTGLKEALKALSLSDPYLLGSADGDEDGEDKSRKTPSGKGGGNRKPGGSSFDDDELRRRYPAIRR